MKVITQRILYPIPAIRRHTYPLHHFCSSSDADPPSNIPQPQSESQSQTSFSSHFSEVKAILEKEPPPHNRSHSLQKFFSSPPQTLPPPKLASLENIRRKISEFRRPSASSPSSSGSGQYISLQELYKRNVIAKADVPSTSSNAPAVKPTSFDALRENILHLQVNTPPAKNESDSSVKNGAVSLARFNESLKLKPDRYQESPLIIGGSESLPSFVEKETSGSESGKVGSTAAMRTEFLKMYDYSELGSKLKMLRPEKKGRWFSLQELNERLAKLRVIEEKESPVRMGGISFKDLRETLVNLSLSEDDNRNRKRMQRLNVLSQLGGTPSYMLSPPKDHLVQKYFHPDNMSAAEKLKLELRKVRDEFKMSESDCGSARVQVAQLTTKIKYLSTVLQKKDKHSRKGLQTMVQRRKKLLKYLRRTDWDSYCLVLSKLGLRDIPDIKA